MSQDNKDVAVNLYSILDNELARMHNLIETYLKLPREEVAAAHSQSYNPYGAGAAGGAGYSSGYSNQNSARVIYDRITHIQDIILQAVLVSDKELQERIAEAALTGEKI